MSCECSKAAEQAAQQPSKASPDWTDTNEKRPREYPNHLAFCIPRNPEKHLADKRTGTFKRPKHITDTLPLMRTDKTLKPGEVDYAVLLPADFKSKEEGQDPYPLIVSFHPAGRDAEHLHSAENAARCGRDIIPSQDVVWAAFSGGMFGNYMSWYNGSHN